MRDNSKVSGHSLSERATRRSITYRNFLSIEPGSFLCLSVCLSVRPSVQGSVCTGIMIAPGLGHLWILHALTGSGYIWLLLRIKNRARERGQRDHAADGWGGSGRGGGGVWGFFASVLWVYICLVSMCFVSKCRGIASTCQQYKSLLSADARKAYLFNTEKN